jgi:hypothetical protein
LPAGCGAGAGTGAPLGAGWGGALLVAGAEGAELGREDVPFRPLEGGPPLFGFWLLLGVPEGAWYELEWPPAGRAPAPKSALGAPAGLPLDPGPIDVMVEVDVEVVVYVIT